VALLAAVAFGAAYGFGQALTDVTQTDTDALSAPYRPLGNGQIDPARLTVMALAGLAICSGILAWLAPLTLVFAAVGVAGLASYTHFKRSSWIAGPLWNSWIVATLPPMGAVITARQTGGHVDWLTTLLVSMLTLVAYANFVIVGYLKDIDADRATGYRTIAVVHGVGDDDDGRQRVRRHLASVRRRRDHPSLRFWWRNARGRRRARCGSRCGGVGPGPGSSRDRSLACHRTQADHRHGVGLRARACGDRAGSRRYLCTVAHCGRRLGRLARSDDAASPGGDADMTISPPTQRQMLAGSPLAEPTTKPANVRLDTPWYKPRQRRLDPRAVGVVDQQCKRTRLRRRQRRAVDRTARRTRDSRTACRRHR